MSSEQDYLTECGLPINLTKLTLSDKDTILEAVAQHFCIYLCKAELDQIVEGFGVCL